MNAYFIRSRGKTLGPFSLQQLKELRQRGRLSASHQVSNDGRHWAEATSLTEVFPDRHEDVATADDVVSAEEAQTIPPVLFFLDAEGNRRGPLAEDDLLALVNCGQLSPVTMVWKEGMPQWTRLKDLRKQSAPKLDDSTGRSRESPAEIVLTQYSWLLLVTYVHRTRILVSTLEAAQHRQMTSTLFSFIYSFHWFVYIPLLGGFGFLYLFLIATVMAPFFCLFDFCLGRRVLGMGLFHLEDADGRMVVTKGFKNVFHS